MLHGSDDMLPGTVRRRGKKRVSRLWQSAKRARSCCLFTCLPTQKARNGKKRKQAEKGASIYEIYIRRFSNSFSNRMLTLSAFFPTVIVQTTDIQFTIGLIFSLKFLGGGLAYQELRGKKLLQSDTPSFFSPL